MGYQDDVPVGEGLGRWANVKLLVPGSRHALFEASHAKSPTTLFRIFPEFDMQGVEQPMRIGTGPCAFSYWIRGEKATRYFGSGKLTMCTRVKGKPYSYEGPVDRFASAMRRDLNIKNEKCRQFPPEWLSWIGEKGLLSRIAIVGLIQGMLFEHEGRLMVDPVTRSYKPIYPAVLMVTQTARINLGNLGDDPKNGDFVSCAGGRMLRVTFIPQSGTSLTQYVASLEEKPFPINPETARKNWLPWDKMLQFFTEEEQIDLLCQNFPPEAVDYVFGDTNLREAFPVGVAGKWAAYQAKRNAPQMMPTAQVQVQAPGQPQQYPGGVASWPGAPAAAPLPSQLPQAFPQAQPAQPAQPAPEAQPYVPGQPPAHSGIPTSFSGAPAGDSFPASAVESPVPPPPWAGAGAGVVSPAAGTFPAEPAGLVGPVGPGVLYANPADPTGIEARAMAARKQLMDARALVEKSNAEPGATK